MKQVKCVTSIVVVCAMFICFSGCDSTLVSTIKEITKYTTEGHETKIVPDPELEGTLNVDFVVSSSEEYIEQAEKMFHSYYPNVELTITPTSDWDFVGGYQKLQTELMAGSGPDVFPVVGEILDPYKTMLAGAYKDLAPYFEKDTAFNVNDFNQAVLYGAQLNGKQFIVPLFYNLPLLLTTQSTLQEVGFNIENCTDYFQTGKEFAKIVKENKLSLEPENFCPSFKVPKLCLSYMGTNWIDYRTKEVRLDSAEAKQAYRMYKEYFLPTVGDYGSGALYYITICADQLHRKEMAFCSLEVLLPEMLVNNVRSLTGLGEEPELIAWRDVNGKIQAQSILSLAVNANSQNPEASYRFIKMLMSPEFNDTQIYPKKIYPTGIPLCNQSIRIYLEAQTDNGGYTTAEGENFHFGEMPQEFVDQLLSYMDEVGGLNLDPSCRYTVEKIMQDYLDGNRSYEECIKQAQQSLDIYMSE